MPKLEKEKYNYLLAFILGMTMMVAVFVLFESVTSSEYRVRTSSYGDTASGTILTSAVTTANAPDTSSAPAEPAAYLGIEAREVNDIIAEQLGLDSDRGVLINLVFTGSPAESAVLRRGDVILSLDNRAVKDVDGFKTILLGLSPGDTVRISFVRNGIKDSTYAQLTATPSSISQSSVSGADTSASVEDTWGITLSPLTDSLEETHGIPGNIAGVMILSVEPGSMADDAGLEAGDVITGVDKVPVNSMTDLFDAIQADTNNSALLDVYSQGRMTFVPLDTSAIQAEDQIQAQDQLSLQQRIFSFFNFTGGIPFADDDDEEEGPKGGKFADDTNNVTLTADSTAAFNRPSDVVGDTNTGGTSTSETGMNRPSSVPSQTTSSGPNNDIVFFIGLLFLVILYLAYREYHRK